MLDATALMDEAFVKLESAREPRLGRFSDPSRAEAAAKDFEAFFISMVLENMFAGIKTDGPFGGGNGEKIFRSVMIEEYGKQIVERGGFGIADMVQKEILKLQEVTEG
jgi:Rod binding domain-containing protein